MKRTSKVHNVSHFPSSKNLNQFGLHHLLKNILFVAQCFALLPVNGIFKDVKNLEFKWISVKIVYTFSTIFLLTIYCIFIFIYCIYNSENFLSFVVVAWNIRALVGIIIFLRLARKWPLFLQHWTNMEINMLNHGPLVNLKLRFQIISFVFLITGILDHTLFVYGGVRTALANMKENDAFIKTYFEVMYLEFFNTVQYAHWKAALVEFLALITTFLWQWCDLLIVLLSSALALRFRQISKRIKHKKKMLNEAEWRDLRKQYNGIALLCRMSNNILSEVILLSFFGNAYFLSTSMFQCFGVNTKFEVIIYYWCSALVSFFHLLIVCLYASWVHEESLEPLSEICSVPTRNMSHETDRMLYQMATKDLALYGGGLFKVTRGVILNIMSAVVTVQLIFVQFNAKFLLKIK